MYTGAPNKTGKIGQKIKNFVSQTKAQNGTANVRQNSIASISNFIEDDNTTLPTPSMKTGNNSKKRDKPQGRREYLDLGKEQLSLRQYNTLAREAKEAGLKIPRVFPPQHLIWYNQLNGAQRIRSGARSKLENIEQELAMLEGASVVKRGHTVSKQSRKHQKEKSKANVEIIAALRASMDYWKLRLLTKVPKTIKKTNHQLTIDYMRSIARQKRGKNKEEKTKHDVGLVLTTRLVENGNLPSIMSGLPSNPSVLTDLPIAEHKTKGHRESGPPVTQKSSRSSQPKMGGGSNNPTESVFTLESLDNLYRYCWFDNNPFKMDLTGDGCVEWNPGPPKPVTQTQADAGSNSSNADPPNRRREDTRKNKWKEDVDRSGWVQNDAMKQLNLKPDQKWTKQQTVEYNKLKAKLAAERERRQEQKRSAQQNSSSNGAGSSNSAVVTSMVATLQEQEGHIDALQEMVEDKVIDAVSDKIVSSVKAQETVLAEYFDVPEGGLTGNGLSARDPNYAKWLPYFKETPFVMPIGMIKGSGITPPNAPLPPPFWLSEETKPINFTHYYLWGYDNCESLTSTTHSTQWMDAYNAKLDGMSRTMDTITLTLAKVGVEGPVTLGDIHEDEMVDLIKDDCIPLLSQMRVDYHNRKYGDYDEFIKTGFFPDVPEPNGDVFMQGGVTPIVSEQQWLLLGRSFTVGYMIDKKKKDDYHFGFSKQPSHPRIICTKKKVAVQVIPFSPPVAPPLVGPLFGALFPNGNMTNVTWGTIHEYVATRKQSSQLYPYYGNSEVGTLSAVISRNLKSHNWLTDYLLGRELVRFRINPNFSRDPKHDVRREDLKHVKHCRAPLYAIFELWRGDAPVVTSNVSLALMSECYKESFDLTHGWFDKTTSAMNRCGVVNWNPDHLDAVVFNSALALGFIHCWNISHMRVAIERSSFQGGPLMTSHCVTPF